MSNIIDYMKWRGDVTFGGSPFNEVDNLIFSMATFVDLSGIVSEDPYAGSVSFPEAVKQFNTAHPGEDYLGILIPRNMLDIARVAASCQRYSKVRLAGFVNEIDEMKEMQFSALTYILPDNSIFIAFRGTDDTIVGWKEDLMLGFKTPVAAHERAAEYIKAAGRAFPSASVRVGGHSKGGNIAMWAASHAPEDVKERITTIYNDDGPGFMREIIESEEYRSVADRIITIVPQSSIVGTILEQSPNKKLIKSSEIGINQHDPLSWEVLGKSFIRVKKRSPFGEQADDIMKRWVESMNEEEREKFADALFSVVDSTGAKTLTDLNHAKFKNIGIILKSLRDMDKDGKDSISFAVKQLREAANRKK